MNCIECFNRSRNGLQVCSPFFFVWCLDVSRRGVLQPVPFLRRSWCLDAARCGVLQPVHPLRRSWCLNAARCGVLQPVHPLRRSWCASMVPTLLRYTYYSISQILEILQRCPHSWQLVIDFIAYHRDQGIVNKCK